MLALTKFPRLWSEDKMKIEGWLKSSVKGSIEFYQIVSVL